MLTHVTSHSFPAAVSFAFTTEEPYMQTALMCPRLCDCQKPKLMWSLSDAAIDP